MSKKLNIGAGVSYLPGFTNIDVSPRADLQLDLNNDRLPFDDDSIELIFSYHCLEHLDNYLFALGEIHRVLQHQGRLLIGVPYVTLTEFNLVNPYHRQNFNEYSFDFFDPAKLKNSAAEENEILFQKAFHRFHYLPEFAKEPPDRQEWSRRHLFNVVRAIDFGLVAIKDRNTSASPDDMPRDKMIAEFDNLLASRIAYESD